MVDLIKKIKLHRLIGLERDIILAVKGIDKVEYILPFYYYKNNNETIFLCEKKYETLYIGRDFYSELLDKYSAGYGKERYDFECRFKDIFKYAIKEYVDITVNRIVL